ncbi:trypsin 3A1-like [Plutella xylostella]|uniref:trypsin 3A1-like n=1 Tax=Plutella xylostella TaxID=51655 RepID=UPI002032A8F1|nr:trypsin 3A1-like [Plutella xylostella]
MSNVYWKEFKGWLQAFTNTEKALSLLFFVLLVVFLVLLVFVIVHLSICPEKLETEEFSSTTESTTGTISEATVDKETEGQQHSSPTTPWSVTPDNDTDVATAATDVTIGPGDTCTWGRRTSTATRYLEEAAGAAPGAGAGELARYTLALVQLRPRRGGTFGCTATAVAPRWALTAASCLHAIQEEDSLDGLVLRGAWRGAWGAGVAAVRVHPQYHGSVQARDAAALRAAAPLLPPGAPPVPRASLLDYLLVTIGERFTLLGYGKFRSVDRGAAGRVLRATVYSVPAAQCAAPRDERAREPRDLPPLGAGALCAAPGGPRAACRHCAGSPLYRGRVLYGFMGHNPRCGVSCGPALFVNIAAIQHWLDELEAE